MGKFYSNDLSKLYQNSLRLSMNMKSSTNIIDTSYTRIAVQNVSHFHKGRQNWNANSGSDSLFKYICMMTRKTNNIDRMKNRMRVTEFRRNRRMYGTNREKGNYKCNVNFSFSTLITDVGI